MHALLVPCPTARAVQRKFTRRPKVLVLHGKGMRGRGYERRDLFGDITLRQYNRRIRKWARWVGLDVTIYQSDSAEDLAHRIKEAEVNGAAAVVRAAVALRIGLCTAAHGVVGRAAGVQHGGVLQGGHRAHRRDQGVQDSGCRGPRDQPEHAWRPVHMWWLCELPGVRLWHPRVRTHWTTPAAASCTHPPHAHGLTRVLQVQAGTGGRCGVAGAHGWRGRQVCSAGRVVGCSVVQCGAVLSTHEQIDVFTALCCPLAMPLARQARHLHPKVRHHL